MGNVVRLDFYRESGGKIRTMHIIVPVEDAAKLGAEAAGTPPNSSN
jgi:hypothetical protein